MDDSCQPLSLKALCTLPPVLLDDDEEDDFETLQVIQRRFSAYYSADTTKSRRKDSLQTPNQVLASSVASENDTSNNLFVNRINACEGFPASEEACNNHHLLRDNVETLPSCSIQWQQSEEYNMSIVSQKDSNFPKSAQVFIDAIQKNRSYQNFIQSKLTLIESRIEEQEIENKKLKERVQILKDFQVSCRKITGRPLSQKKDPRVQMILWQKLRNSNDSELGHLK
ncbi:hypothetical protein Patl1_19700 [Pistacia atlantica]|uniref:Uncharacterized protein n=1 Tax=Pistacia atlantica TaxID=434234 RepID=A0ACC1BZP3_9ROSI|nr:hypothetical protein Patl1_19700 [Pistacia atlantica]